MPIHQGIAHWRFDHRSPSGGGYPAHICLNVVNTAGTDATVVSWDVIRFGDSASPDQTLETVTPGTVSATSSKRNCTVGFYLPEEWDALHLTFTVGTENYDLYIYNNGGTEYTYTIASESSTGVFDGLVTDKVGAWGQFSANGTNDMQFRVAINRNLLVKQVYVSVRENSGWHWHTADSQWYPVGCSTDGTNLEATNYVSDLAADAFGIDLYIWCCTVSTGAGYAGKTYDIEITYEDDSVEVVTVST